MFIFQMHEYTSGIIGESYFVCTRCHLRLDYVSVVHIASQESVGRYESIPRVSPMSVDHKHASPVHGVNKAVDKAHWNCGPYPEKIYNQICCSYRPWSRFIEFSLDFDLQVSIGFQCGLRAGHIVLLEKVPGGSGSVGEGLD